MPATAIVLAMAAALAPAQSAATDVVATLVMDVCVPALTSGASDASRLPPGARRLSPEKLQELAYKPGSIAFEVRSRDGPVWVEMSPQCSVMATIPGEVGYIDAILRTLPAKGLTARNRRDEQDKMGTTTSLEVPVTERKFIALVATYVTGEQAKSDPYFQITAVSVKNP